MSRRIPTKVGASSTLVFLHFLDVVMVINKHCVDARTLISTFVMAAISHRSHDRLGAASRVRPLNIGGSVDSRHGWTVVIASFLLMAIGGGGIYIVVVALKPIAAEFGWPRTIPSLGYSLGLLGTGIGGIAMGWWADRVGVGPPALVGTLAIAFGAYWSSLSDNASTLLLAHGLFIGLLGNAAMFGPLIANATRWINRRRGIAVAIVASGQTLAGAIWPPFFRAMVETEGWRATFRVFAVICLVALPPLLLVVWRQPPTMITRTQSQSTKNGGDILGFSPTTVLVLLCLAIVGCCVAMSVPIVHLVAHATDLGYSGVLGAQLLSVMLVFAVISRLLWGAISDKIGGLRTLLITSVAQATMLGGFAVAEDIQTLFVVAALYGLGYGGIVPCYPVTIRELFPEEGIGWRMGAVLLFGTIGMATGGWMAAQIFDYMGRYDPAFLAAMGFNLTNVVIVTGLVLRQRRLRG